VRQPREAAQVVELPQEGRPDGTAVCQQRRGVGLVPPETDGSPAVVPRRPVGGSPEAVSQWQAIDSQVVEQPDRVAQCPGSGRARPAFVGRSMADCAHDRRHAAGVRWEPARPVAVAAPTAFLVRAEQCLARQRPVVPHAAALRQDDRLRLALAAEVVAQRASA
jgi:hypothetical protein